MSLIIKYLMENDYKLYYLDTVSMMVNKPLPDWMVSKNELGKMKLEHIIEEGVFLAPKVYAFKTYDGGLPSFVLIRALRSYGPSE